MGDVARGVTDRGMGLPADPAPGSTFLQSVRGREPLATGTERRSKCAIVVRGIAPSKPIEERGFGVGGVSALHTTQGIRNRRSRRTTEARIGDGAIFGQIWIEDFGQEPLIRSRNRLMNPPFHCKRRTDNYSNSTQLHTLGKLS